MWRRLLIIAASGASLAGCYAPPQTYPRTWPAAAPTLNPCLSLSGTYQARGEASEAERLPKNTPNLVSDLIGPLRGGFAVDRVRLTAGSDQTMTVDALAGTDAVRSETYAVTPSGPECTLLAPNVVTRSLGLQKAADGSLIVHITEQSLLYIFVPPTYAEARWARFAPAP